jgi:hypothetical protein
MSHKARNDVRSTTISLVNALIRRPTARRACGPLSNPNATVTARDVAIPTQADEQMSITAVTTLTGPETNPGAVRRTRSAERGATFVVRSL